MAGQVGGNHYEGMAIQPFEFAHANLYDPEAFSVLKYVSRHRAKGGEEDLLKARHIVDIRLGNLKKYLEPRICRDRIKLSVFVEKNGIPEPDAKILRELHLWVLGLTNRNDDASAGFIKNLIDLSIAHHYL